MLRGVDSRISPEVLYSLALMGHGDQIAVVDRHFPAASKGRRSLWLPGVSAPEAADAILSLMPLDGFSEYPVKAMKMPSEAWAQSDVQDKTLSACIKNSRRKIEFEYLDRERFYDLAQECYAIVATGEDRPYGCFIFTKGVLPEFGPFVKE